MKGFKFLALALLMTVAATSFTSCKEKNKPVSIVGTWEIVEATLTNSEGANNTLSEEIGQVWKFDEKGKLTVGKEVVDYTVNGSVLETSYAQYYKARNFVVETLAEKDLVLTASYSEADKVGSRTYLTTLKFVRK